ncbi:MAG TPA: prepilin-type N-terminal cleavage/methylation domain-containing protein, partial [Synergistaceae bacterium]|nr:prepilin-type N-terminal cleavage/methylation domain-containing protein [Synergistaceae bacterium]
MNKRKKNPWPSGRVNTPRRLFPRSSRQAFSLVELLMVIVVGGICMAAAYPLLWVFFSTFSQNDEYVSAQENAYNATLALAGRAPGGAGNACGERALPEGGEPSKRSCQR